MTEDKKPTLSEFYLPTTENLSLTMRINDVSQLLPYFVHCYLFLQVLCFDRVSGHDPIPVVRSFDVVYKTTILLLLLESN